MWIILAVLVAVTQANDNLKVVYEWKQIDFEYPNIQERQFAISNGNFIQENVIPVGLEVYKDRLFLTLPRWKKGVAASLAYIDLNDNMTDKSPQLKPYPSWSAHQMSQDEVPEIISPFRVRADACSRLWVLDTGIDNILGESNATVLAPTRLLIYDLHSDNLLRTFTFPPEYLKEESFFASIAVEDDDCENTYAYAADLGKPSLVVYSWKSQGSWRIQHNFFHPDPTAGNFSINGINFQWNDGLFGLALSKPQADGETILYFHPFVSKDEFSVSTKYLKDPNTANNANYHEFKRLGTRGENAQSNAEFLDKNTGVLFYTLPNLNAIACWKTTTKEYNLKSQGRIFMDKVLMEFPNDVKVDDKKRLWVISDRLQKFMYDNLDPNEVNFRILMAPVKEAIEHTACDVKTKPLPEIITKLNDIIKPTTNAPVSKDSAGTLEASLLIISVAVLSRLL
ncbi:hypothetical protein PVAND_005166 [Polypedilum vanderplanki]|uniref:Protein yellow n=1 Tax=Polypedilum vanderplanki TaxID=319348 RepID=A0A9J6C0B4_POLVA|nr:hypothetical protein PVAND_005166 [Polypedilum vanderplanki]